MSTSFQTVRLAQGRHRSAAEGACAVELASMLAGERFSDRPRCVDPVLAAYMRAFNDRLGPAERQGLRPYAAAAVGTRAGRRARRARARLCRADAGLPARGGRLLLVAVLGLRALLRPQLAVAELAARRAFSRGDVAGGWRLLDALIAVTAVPGDGLEAAPLARPVARPSQERVPAGIA